MPKVKNERKYAINNKLIMERWDYNKNNKLGLNPSELTEGSHVKAYFICPRCNNEWLGEIRYVVRYNGSCPFCAKIKRKENMYKTKISTSKKLFETNPELKEEWDYRKNEEIGLDPNMLVAGSNKEAYWICPLGHSFKAQINNRVSKHTGCTFCSGQAVLEGFNDLKTVRPDLLKEWDYVRNNDLGLFPNKISKGSHQKAYWICPLGHKYKKGIKERVAGHGCTQCAKESQTSFPEQAIYYYISKVFNEAKNRYGKPEIDIYIPSLKFGIEYDGLYAHKKKAKSEENKNNILKSRGIRLIRIKEVTKLKEDEENIIYCKTNANNTYLNDVIKKIEKMINKSYGSEINLNPNIKRDRIKIEEQYIFLKKQNSISILYPEIAKEWDYAKNGTIKPEYVSYGSSKKYFWICPKGHSYECSPKDRVKGKSCQICAGFRYIKGVNDLETKFPKIIKFWDYSKNKVKPCDIKYTNDNIYWWKCDKGHSYQTTIKTMIKYKECLACSKNLNILVQGVNDLKTVNPELSKEWDYSKNPKGPENYTYKSNLEVYWKCKKCNYSWKSRIHIRTNCPNCKKNALMINVYSINTGELFESFKDTVDLCNKMSIDYNKQKGNITSVCQRKQKTFQNKYILRHNNDDEFKNLTDKDRKQAIDNYLLKNN